MKDYILAQSFNRANTQDRVWYAMDTNALDAMKSDEKIAFGDKVYVIKAKKFYIMGNDNTWYEMF